MADAIEAKPLNADGVMEIRLAGRFTFTDYTKFRTAVTQAVEAKVKGLTFDLGALEFLDSAALGMLLLARDEAQKIGAGVAIRGASGQVERVLDVARFRSLFHYLD